jgi:hypothetical protein
MLTKEQYKALRRYLESDIPVGEEGLSDVDQYLSDQKYIEPSSMGSYSAPELFCVFYNAYRITELGRSALAEYEQRWKERLFQIGLVILGSVLTLLVEWIYMLIS